MTAPVALRDPTVISAESDALPTAAESGSAFHQGARDALRWLLVGGPGPLTGGITGLPIRLRAVVAELSAAEAEHTTSATSWPSSSSTTTPTDRTDPSLNNHQPDEPLQRRPAPTFGTFDATASAD